VDLLFYESRQFSYKAETNLELLAISKNDFNKVFFIEFRDIGGELYRNALRRRERLLAASEDAVKYCERKINQFGEVRPSVIRNRKKEFSFKAQNSLKMRFSGKGDSEKTGDEQEKIEKEGGPDKAKYIDNPAELAVLESSG
jgi:hypothetical protein